MYPSSKNLKFKAFVNEIIDVCKKHQLSIAHQDYQGAFIIEDYNKINIEWLQAADNRIKDEENKEHIIERNAHTKDI